MYSNKSTSEFVELTDSLNLNPSQTVPYIGQSITENRIKEFTTRFLQSDEVLLGAFYGNHYDSKKNRRIGLPHSYLIATNQRLIRLTFGIVCEDESSLSYNQIASVGISSKFSETEIIMSVEGKELLFHTPFIDDVQPAWKLIRDQLATVKLPSVD